MSIEFKKNSKGYAGPNGLLLLGAVCLSFGLASIAPSHETDDPARPVGTIAAVDPMVATPVQQSNAVPPIDKASKVVLQVASAADLAKKFAAMGYRYEAVRDGHAMVPRIHLASLPHDMDALPSADDRKELFLRTMLPLVLSVNEQVMHDRWRLLALRDRFYAGDVLTGDDIDWLSNLAVQYRVKEIDIDKLLLHVDIVPPSMALAQAAVESGWGTSRVARLGNAVFGQITLGDKAVVPEDDTDGQGLRYAAFEQLLDGTASYIRNLNSHPAYAEFRRLRAEQRAVGDRPDGAILLGGLLHYSELGQRYVDFVREILQANDMEQFDRARLGVGSLEIASAI